MFFRGWLQQAIAEELPRHLVRWAPLVGALAFACAHVGSPWVPQFAMGLVAGLLWSRSGGLGPSMVAHAVHNGLVLWWAGHGGFR